MEIPQVERQILTHYSLTDQTDHNNLDCYPGTFQSDLQIPAYYLELIQMWFIEYLNRVADLHDRLY